MMEIVLILNNLWKLTTIEAIKNKFSGIVIFHMCRIPIITQNKINKEREHKTHLHQTTDIKKKKASDDLLFSFFLV